MDLKSWPQHHRLSVEELALELGILQAAAQDWLYRGVAPSKKNPTVTEVARIDIGEPPKIVFRLENYQ